MNIAMTHEELIKEIHQLPLDKRKVVLEAIERSVQDEQQSAEKPRSIDNEGQLTIEERLAVVQRLFGILKRDGEAPTDEELKEEYANYLAEKYS
jgi:hypothetical protein